MDEPQGVCWSEGITKVTSALAGLQYSFLPCSGQNSVPRRGVVLNTWLSVDLRSEQLSSTSWKMKFWPSLVGPWELWPWLSLPVRLSLWKLFPGPQLSLPGHYCPRMESWLATVMPWLWLDVSPWTNLTATGQVSAASPVLKTGVIWHLGQRGPFSFTILSNLPFEKGLKFRDLFEKGSSLAYS